MKKIRNIIIMAIVLGMYWTMSACTYLHDDEYTPLSEQKISLTEQYVNSVLSGSLVGCSIGLLTAIVDHILPDIWPITWLIFGIERQAITDAMSADMDVSHVPHRKSTMAISSCLAAWCTYYIAYEQVHGRPPFRD